MAFTRVPWDRMAFWKWRMPRCILCATSRSAARLVFISNLRDCVAWSSDIIRPSLKMSQIHRWGLNLALGCPHWRLGAQSSLQCFWTRYSVVIIRNVNDVRTSPAHIGRSVNSTVTFDLLATSVQCGKLQTELWLSTWGPHCRLSRFHSTRAYNTGIPVIFFRY
jgi:hypothetical protein